MNAYDLEFFKEIVGGDFRVGFGEDYNIFCCEEGIKIANTLETKEAIIDFHKSDYKSQVDLVPSLSSDHSGNTFNMACRLAISYLPRLSANLLVENRDKKINDILQ